MTDSKTHECDFCGGTVRDIVSRNEPIRVCGGVVLLDGPIIGKCEQCGHRYFPADVVKRAEAAAEAPERAGKIASVPVIAA